MNCPRCASPLSPMVYEGITLQTCGACGGEFLGPDQLGHVVRTREERFDPALQREIQDREPIFGQPDEDAAERPACPQCAVPMTLINYAGDTGVSVDRCDRCGGTWLDHEELEKIQALLERWSDEAPQRIAASAEELERAREEIARRTSKTFAGSRFAFVNAIINRLLDAA